MTSSDSRKRKAPDCLDSDASEVDKDWEQVISIPIHRVILMSRCAYYRTLLMTSLGRNSTTVIREYAGSREEVLAIISAAYCVYTGKMPLCASEVEVGGMRDVENASAMQKNVMTLVVSWG